MSSNLTQVAVTPLEKRLEGYKRFQELLALGRSKFQVARTIKEEFGVSHGTVYAWANGRSPLGTRAGRISHTKELFYVIGSLLGDGCIYFWRHRYYIWLVGEKGFCEKYAKRVTACSSKKAARAYHLRGRNVWFVAFQNAELYFLIKRTREDLNVLTKLITTGDRFVNALQLIEGFFDAEGCVKIIKEEARRTPKINLDFSNTNLTLLKLIRRELDYVLGIKARLTSQQDKRPNRKVMYHLRIYRKDAVRKFLLRISTTKLKPEKIPYVENWLGK